jgi:hypothetical protein
MADSVESKPRVRSPAYPSVGLEDALAKAKILYDKEGQGRHPIPATTIARDWEYSSLNGSALTTISALKQFGLLTEIDVEEDRPRQLKLSQIALNLIVRKSDSKEWLESAKSIALLPKLYTRLWKLYSWPLPSDDTIRTYLELEEKFNTKFIASIIKDYKRTIEVAKLASGDKMTEVGGGADNEQSPPGGEEEAVNQQGINDSEKPKGQIRPPAGIRQAVFPGEAGDVVVRWPAILTAAEYDDIEGWLDMLKRNIKRSVKPEESEPNN